MSCSSNPLIKKVNKILKRGDTYSDVFYITYTDDSNNRFPLDITGATLYFTVKNNYEDSDANALMQIINTTHDDPAKGVTSITIGATDWGDIKKGSYIYDVQLSFVDGTIKTLIEGKIKVLNDVTKS